MKKTLKRLLSRTKTKPETTNRPVQVVVGLRNPGADYEGTRHNLGFEIVDCVVDRAGQGFGRGPRGVPSLTASNGIGDTRTLFVAPTTFMNESGMAVRQVLDYYKIPPSELLVVHDDIDLEFGRLRLQEGGGSGGHNGIRSLEQHLGTREFSRLKAGVGRPPGSQNPADFVLRPFAIKERPEVDVLVEDAADVVERWIEDRSRAQEQAAHRGKD